MPTPREQAGGLSEASRLLQEGLQLLDERTREVDGLVQAAKEQAREITYDAQQRAREITADAERQRAELDQQVADLRGEVAQMRDELAQLRAAQPQKGEAQKGGRGSPRVSPSPIASPAAATSTGTDGVSSAAIPAGEPSPGATDVASTRTEGDSATDPRRVNLPTLAESSDPVTARGRISPVDTGQAVGAAEEAQAATAGEATDAPRWGRPSSIAQAQQAIRARSSRPRWLPRWLPFVILLLAGAGAVTASVNGQSAGRSGEPTSGPEGIALTFASAATNRPGVSIAGIGATSIATSLVAVGAVGTLTQTTQPSSPSFGPTLLPTSTTSTTSTASVSSASLVTRTPTPTVAPARTPGAVAPLPGRLISPSAAPPGDVSPEGPIVAAYTTYATYAVRSGDTLNRVATEFGVTGESIIRASGLADPNLLHPDQVLTIPRESGWLYRVQAADTLEAIAMRFSLSVSELLAASPLNSPGAGPGDLLFIPNRAVPGTKQ